MFKSKVAAFTLLEALVSLLILSGGVLIFQSMTQLLSSEIHYQTTNEKKEWLLFADQLEEELNRSHIQKVEGNKLYAQQDGKDIAFSKSKKDDFRKTDNRGRGYQPMVGGLTDCVISQEGQVIQLHFTFKGGLEREFIYLVEKTS